MIELRIPTEKQSMSDTPVQVAEQSTEQAPTSIRRSSVQTIEQTKEFLVHDQTLNKLDTR